MDAIRKLFRVPFIEKLLAFPIKPPDSLLGKIVPGNYLYKHPTIRNISRGGINLELDLSEYVQHYIYYNFTDNTLDTLCSLAKPGMTILDIGTNIGYFALRLAKVVGENGRVHAFEPNADTYKEARNNITVFNAWCKNISLNNIGLGDKKGQYKLYAVSEQNNGMNQIQNHVLDKPFTIVNVEALDEYIEEKQIPSIGLIKIDTEGYELNVLKGAAKTLARCKPILFVEINDNNLRVQSNSAKELITFIKNFGYTVMNSESNKEIQESDDFANCHFDGVCLPS